MGAEYKTITNVTGPLIFVEKTEWVGYGELVEIRLADGTRKRGQVLDTSKEVVVVQVFEGTAGIDRASSVKFLGETIKLAVSKDMLGRILSGSGEPIDGGPPPLPEKRGETHGAALPPPRVHPDGDLHDRRAEHARPRAEAPPLLWRGPAPQRGRAPDCAAG